MFILRKKMLTAAFAALVLGSSVQLNGMQQSSFMQSIWSNITGLANTVKAVVFWQSNSMVETYFLLKQLAGQQDVVWYIILLQLHHDQIAFARRLHPMEAQSLFRQLPSESSLTIAIILRAAEDGVELHSKLGCVDFVRNIRNWVNFEQFEIGKNTSLLSQNYLPLVLPLIEPFIGNNVVRLNLANKQLKMLPVEIGLLINIKELYLGFNELKGLPGAIAQLKNLEKLYLNHNQLEEVPEPIYQLKNLQELSLKQNKLTEDTKQMLLVWFGIGIRL